MKNSAQLSFAKTHWKFRYSHGGTLRNQRAGRGARSLSSKQPIHLVLKANKECLPSGFRTSRRFILVHKILKKYSGKFFVKVEQIAVAEDHLHLLVRFSKRSQIHNFLRVFAGQITQTFQKEDLIKLAVTDTPKTATSAKQRAEKKFQKLWKFRPFSRVVIGWKAYQIVRDYIQLNEKEASGKIPYKKQRLKGLSSTEWEILWA